MESTKTAFLPKKRVRKGNARVLIITTGNHNVTRHNFTRFKDVEKCSHVRGMSELKKYFQQFDCLSIDPNNQNNNFTDIFDAQFESVLGLPVIGKLESKMTSTIMSLRCSVSDISLTIHAKKHFTYFYGRSRWDCGLPMTLTYAFSFTNMIDYISLPKIKTVFKRLFSMWASIILVNSMEIDDYPMANIRIEDFKVDHDNNQPFEGVLRNGRFHLYEDETWAIAFEKVKSKVYFEPMATHEIGHMLELTHSSINEIVMYLNLKPQNKKMNLKLDNVESTQALYG
uniref:Peptidase metallopeptidase domain-containing protein n=1 Tax=Gossypium raimondii TaxID=29730 RepID=A0A0D2Q0F4_GOSRA|nr:hypothetical protein B456_008G234900 [Gossypium raimondii]